MAIFVMQLANKIIREKRRACIVITHNVSFAIEYCDLKLLLKNGNFIKADKKTSSPLYANCRIWRALIKNKFFKML